MRLIEKIRSLYLDNAPLTERDYRRSRMFSIMEGASARTIFTLTSGAYLAGFAEYLGADDRFNGILAAVPVLACGVQVLSPLVLERLERRKLLVTVFCFLHRLLLGLMLFIPLLVRDQTSRLLFLSVMFFIAYLLVQFATPAASNWVVSLTQPSGRGRFFGLRETYILAGVTIISLVAGNVMDAFEKSGRQFTGFVFIFSFVLLLTGANLFFLSSMKEPPVQIRKKPYSLKNIFSMPLKDSRYRKIVILLFLWNSGLQIGGPYFAVYMVTGLKLDYTFIMLMGLVASVTNVFMSRIWGRLADKKSWAFTTKMSVGLLGLTHFLWFFVDSGNVYFLAPFLHILSGVSWSGINISIFNIQFQYSPEEGRTVYLGFGAALGGLVGFISTLIGSVIVGLIGTDAIRFAGFSAGGMQTVFALSGIGLAACAGFIHFAIKPNS